MKTLNVQDIQKFIKLRPYFTTEELSRHFKATPMSVGACLAHMTRANPPLIEKDPDAQNSDSSCWRVVSKNGVSTAPKKTTPAKQAPSKASHMKVSVKTGLGKLEKDPIQTAVDDFASKLRDLVRAEALKVVQSVFGALEH